MADRNDAEAMREALSGRRFEVVFDNVYDWERGTTAAQVEATVRACGDRLSRYIFMSSVAAYGDGLNHKEGDPLAPDYHPDPYVRNKATTERLLFRMHAQAGFPVVTFRPPFVYGPRQSVLPRAVLLGPPARRAADHHPRRRPPADAVRVREGSGAGHDARHGGAPSGGRGLQYRRSQAGDAGGIRGETGESGECGADSGPGAARRDPQAGGNAMDEPYYFGEYLDVPPITENIGKVTRVLKMKLTPFEAGLKDTYKWYTRESQAADRQLRVRRQAAVHCEERHQERLPRQRIVVVNMKKLLLAFSLCIAPLFAQGAPPQGAADQPYTLEYYYKVQWGHQQEFLQLFLKNHYPLLQKNG